VSSSTAETALRRTSLYDQHVAAGGKLVPFAGWEMPVQYEGIRAEHLAVRTGVGMFDVSHMGQVETRGPQALEFLQLVLSNDVRRVPEGGAQYSVLCREDGGVLDDLFTYRLAECAFLTVTNAANHDKDVSWLSARARASGHDVDVIDVADRFAMLAVQGPGARALVESVADGALPPRMHCCERGVARAGVIVAGTGYTGEDGVECSVPAAVAPSFWEAVLGTGTQPAGLGARDTLRLEAALPLHGHELGPGITPLQAGLGWVVAWSKPEGFRGRAALEREKGAGVSRRLAGLATEGRQPPRTGAAVVVDGQAVGEVTSGNFSPVLGHGIALAFVPPDLEVGAAVTLDLRGRQLPARVVPLPFVEKKG
jgi:aminomethyltransferase